MIELEAVRFSYRGGVRAFSLVVESLHVSKGECVACIGPSGCGKTTLLHLIAGVVVPESGRVEVAGADLALMSDSARRQFRLRHIGLVFQEFELLEYLSACDNAMLQARLLGETSRRDAITRVETLAEKLGVSHVLGRVPRRLSQGERQRIAMCRALATNPAVILCDEPTGNLDPDATQTTLDLLLRHAREDLSTLLMVTHNHALLHRFDRVIDLRMISAARKGAGPTCPR